MNRITSTISLASGAFQTLERSQIPIIESRPQSLDALIQLISAVGLKPFKKLWDEEDELELDEFVEEAMGVLLEFVRDSEELVVREKHGEFYWMRQGDGRHLDVDDSSSDCQGSDALSAHSVHISDHDEETDENTSGIVYGADESLLLQNDTIPLSGSIASDLYEHDLRLPPPIPPKVLRSQLESLFKRIDANSNGGLDFGEFSEFFVNALEGERKMKLLQLDDQCYILGETKRTTEQDRKNCHKDKILKLCIDEDNSTYYSLSEHGQVKRWLYVKSTASFVFLSNMSSVTNRVLDIQLYRKWIVFSDIARRFLFFDRVSGELTYTLVGRNGNKFKVRNGFENQNFVSNVRRQLAVQTSKTKDVSATLERMKSLSQRDKSTDLIEFKKNMQRKSYLKSYKRKLFGKKSTSMGAQHEKKHRVYILESLGQNGGIPMSFKITKFKENEFDHHIPAQDVLVIGTDAGTLKSYDISKIFQDDESIITKHKSDCMLYPLKQTDKEHEGWISCLEVDPKEKVVISGSWDCTLKIFSLQYLSHLRTLVGHKKPIYRLQYDPKTQLIASVGREREIFLWKPHSPSAIDIFIGHESPVVDVAFNSKEGQLVSLSEADQVIKVWDLMMYKCIQTIPVQLEYGFLQGDLSCISVDETKNILATGNFVHGYSKIITWEMKKNMNEVSQEYFGHKTSVVKLLWNARDKELVSCDQHSIAVWNCFTGKQIFKFHVDEQIVDMCFDHLMRRIVVSFAESKFVRIYNFYNGQCLKTLMNETSEKEVTYLRFVNLVAQREKVILGGTEEGLVLKWNDSEDVNEDILMRYERSRFAVTCFELCPPDNLIVGYEDGSVWLISFVHGKTRIKKPYQPGRMPVPLLRNDSLRANIQQAGKSVISKISEESMRARKDSLMEQNQKENAQVEAFAFLPKKKPILVCAQGNGLITFFSALDLKHLYAFRATEDAKDGVCCLSVSQDNNIMITGDSQGYICVYDISRIVDPQKRRKQKPEVNPGDVQFKLKFRAFNTNGVTSVVFADALNCILAGGGEKYSCMYTLQGRIIGVYGQTMLWNVESPNSWGVEMMDGVNDKFGFGSADTNTNADDYQVDSSEDGMSVTNSQRRMPLPPRSRSVSPLAARKDLYQVSSSPLLQLLPTRDSSSPPTADMTEGDIISLNDLPTGVHSPIQKRSCSQASQLTPRAQSPVVSSSLMGHVAKALSPIQRSLSRERSDPSMNSGDARPDSWSRLRQSAPAAPGSATMSDFDNLETFIQQQIRFKNRLLEKETVQLPTLAKKTQKSELQNLAVHHHRARSQAAFEHQFRKGRGYEKRLFSYLEVEKTFVNSSMFGNWKNGDGSWMR